MNISITAVSPFNISARTNNEKMNKGPFIPFPGFGTLHVNLALLTLT